MSERDPNRPPNNPFDKSGQSSQSQYERKLARQRQLELMEAAASGTAPSMMLDTSAFASTASSSASAAGGAGSSEDSHGGSSTSLSSTASTQSQSYLRSRNLDATRRFLIEEEPAPGGIDQAIPVSSGHSRGSRNRKGGGATTTTSSTSFFGADPRLSAGGGAGSINIMDHAAGVYQQPRASSRGYGGAWFRNLLGGGRGATAGAAGRGPATATTAQPGGVLPPVDRRTDQSVNWADPDYHAPQPSRMSWFRGLLATGTRRPDHHVKPDPDEYNAAAATDEEFTGDQYRPHTRRRTPLYVAFCNCLRERRVLSCLLLGLGLVLVVLLSVHLGVGWSETRNENVLRARNTERFSEILDFILQNGVSHTDAFLQRDSAELHALKWIAYSDPNRLEPTDPLLLQRYALAAFFYGSYLTFTKSAGKQAPIEFEGQQFQGVPNAGWVRQDYWLSERGICYWFGVTCVHRTQLTQHEDAPVHSTLDHYDANDYVVALNLTNNHVYGPVPAAFKGLETMKKLDLSRNRMHGTFPAAVGRMFALEELLVNDNQLTGTLPTMIGFLEDCKILHLGHNQFHGDVPTELNRLYRLERLSIESNQFSGIIPDLGRLDHLKVLHVNNNRFMSAFPFTLVKSTHLTELRIHQNELYGTIPPEMQSIRKLQHFQLSDNRLSGTLPEHVIAGWTDLKEFQAQQNRFVGDVPAAFASLPDLEILHLNSNLLRGGLTSDWRNASKLRSLHLYENSLGGILPPSLGHTRLRELWINDNNFQGTLPPVFTQLTQLETAYLENNKLTGTIPTTWASLQALETLRLYGNELSGPMPEAICALKENALLSFLAADCQNGQPVQCDCCHKCY